MRKYTYTRNHWKVRQDRGNPDHCEDCGKTGKEWRYEWANLTGNYEDTNDYKMLCRPCHNKFDNLVNNFKSKNHISPDRKKYLREWRLRNIVERRKKEKEKSKRQYQSKRIQAIIKSAKEKIQ